MQLNIRLLPLWIAFSVVTVTIVCAQNPTKYDPANPLDFGFKSLQIRNIGPAGMSGRVTSIAATNTLNPALYAGSKTPANHQ